MEFTEMRERAKLRYEEEQAKKPKKKQYHTPYFLWGPGSGIDGINFESERDRRSMIQDVLTMKSKKAWTVKRSEKIIDNLKNEYTKPFHIWNWMATKRFKDYSRWFKQNVWVDE